MLICGLQKLTLLDYPEKTACTIFTYGCNFRCPFCHNALLVTEKVEGIIDEEEVLSFLKKRQGILDGVCITGGEPTNQKDLIPFMKKIKDMGYLVKLDTNGYNPDVLGEILSQGLADYVAMDLKNSEEKYPLTAGTEIDTEKILTSINLIKEKAPDYEFRTTVVSEFHNEEDIEKICLMAGSNSKLYLQQFKDSGNLISAGLSPWETDRMKKVVSFLQKKGFKVLMRES